MSRLETTCNYSLKEPVGTSVRFVNSWTWFKPLVANSLPLTVPEQFSFSLNICDVFYIKQCTCKSIICWFLFLSIFWLYFLTITIPDMRFSLFFIFNSFPKQKMQNKKKSSLGWNKTYFCQSILARKNRCPWMWFSQTKRRKRSTRLWKHL